MSDAAISKPQQLPFLEAICWQLDIQHLTPKEMLQQYERGWHYRGILADLSLEEAKFVQELSHHYGSWIVMNGQLAQHQAIHFILRQLNAKFLKNCGAYFGGGTFLTLRYDEYRLSQDIDFLCSSAQGYRLLRRAIFDHSYDAIFVSRHGMKFPREIQANQYGIRFPVVVNDLSIKFEIVSEGRIELDSPDKFDELPVSCLSLPDCFAEKLLANADRGLDISVYARDLIDLAVLRTVSAIPQSAITKAENAYPVVEPLQRSIMNFQAKSDYRTICYQALQVRSPHTVINGLDLLATDFDLSVTERMTTEIATNT